MRRTRFFLLSICICVGLFFLYTHMMPTQVSTEPVARPEYERAASSTQTPIQFIAAGIPAQEFTSITWSSVFKKLAINNIRIFLPTFQYQEVPEAKSSGQEVAFLSPCESPHPAHAALKDAHVKLLIPLEVWYPVQDQLPSLVDDPLKQFITCVGREHISGVTLYDEAIHVGVPLQKVKELYERVKLVDPTLLVLMVHAPVTAENDSMVTERERREYFEKVVAYSTYADVVGFDVYGVPALTAKISSPYASGAELSYDRAIEDYMLWLQNRIPNKQHLMVFQAFAFADQYSDEILATLPKELVDTASVSPSQAEIETMVSLAQKYNIAYVAWWGQSFLKKNSTVWESILTTTKSLKK